LAQLFGKDNKKGRKFTSDVSKMEKWKIASSNF